MVRNRLASYLAKELDILGMDMTWTPCSLDGKFHGVYMFCEHIRIDPNRFDLFDREKCGEELANVIAT